MLGIPHRVLMAAGLRDRSLCSFPGLVLRMQQPRQAAGVPCGRWVDQLARWRGHLAGMRSPGRCKTLSRCRHALATPRAWVSDTAQQATRHALAP
jgi:hypothetical protein